MGNARAWICLFLCGTLAMTTGCASIVGKSEYPIRITSRPDQAGITLTDGSGAVVYSGTTPTTVTLPTKRKYFRGHDYKVTFQKDGYAEHVAEIRRGVSGWYIFGNLVFGGVIGWLIVDPATGAMWTLSEEVNADLTPLTADAGTRLPSPAGSANADLRIVTLDDVPPSLRSELVRVE